MSKKLAKNLWMIVPLLFLLTACKKGDTGPTGPTGAPGPEGSGVTLPYTGSISSSGNAFSITNSGTGRAGYFGINNSNSSGNALFATTNGTGAAGYFEGKLTATDIIESTSGGFKFPDGSVQTTAKIDDEDLPLPFSGSISSSNDAFSVTNSGSGRAGYFGGKLTATNVIESTAGGFKFPDETVQTTAAINFTMPYYWNGSYDNILFYIEQTSGSSGAGVAEFIIENTANSNEVLSVRTNGIGSAATFRILNASNERDGIDVETKGTGYAGTFHVDNASNTHAALYATTFGAGEAGKFKIINPSNDDDAIYVETNGTGNAIFASTSGTGRAGYFNGDVHIEGTLSKSSGLFVIDHPLDPENKVLRHSFVESPEMTNIYKGRATLVNGTAVIELPGYFDALNHPEGREINLTCVNGWSPLYLDGGIKNNSFVVKTTEIGNPTQEFSWVIYGVRNDRYAQQNPIIVEQEKGVNNRFKKGEYLNPKVFGKKNDNK